LTSHDGLNEAGDQQQLHVPTKGYDVCDTLHPQSLSSYAGNEPSARPASAPTPDSNSQAPGMGASCAAAPGSPLLSSLSMQASGEAGSSIPARSDLRLAGEPGAAEGSAGTSRGSTNSCSAASGLYQAVDASSRKDEPSQDDITERELREFREAVARGDYESIPARYWAQYGVPRDREGVLPAGCTIHQVRAGGLCVTMGTSSSQVTEWDASHVHNCSLIIISYPNNLMKILLLVLPGVGPLALTHHTYRPPPRLHPGPPRGPPA
jgi:hypothetical protein